MSIVMTCDTLNMRRITSIFALLTILAFFTSCEGLKVLTIHNTSQYDAKVTVRPGLEYSDRTQILNSQNYQISDSSVVLLQPDSSMLLLRTFTGLMFNVKIKERDLWTDYLKIETPIDTVIAHSKDEIIELIYAKRKGRIKGEGRNLATIKIE